MPGFKNHSILFAISIFIFIAAISEADVPNTVNYQGRLTDDGGLPFTGSELIKFKIYGSESGDDSLWSSNFQTVQIDNGLINYELGSNNPLPENLFTGDDIRYLGITVGANPEGTPRVQLLTVPYAHHARFADSVDIVVTDNDWIIDGDDVFHPLGYVGITNTYPRENLVIGPGLGNFAGNRLTIGDDNPGVSTGLVIGKNNDSRCWLLWDVDDSYFSIGTKEEGTNYGNAIYIKNGGVGLGTIPEDTTKLSIIHDYTPSSSTEPGCGVFCSIEAANNDGRIYGGRFYAYHGDYNAGIVALGIGGAMAVGGLFQGSVVGLQADGPIAADFNGDIQVHGNVSKSSGSFKIDHPLDPANKYLQHSFVESPDMMNIYNGNVVTDNNGNAIVELPSYFEALNMEFRYQLTVIGEFAQAIIKEEIKGNKFKISTDKPNIKVSWLVTGIRQDKWANEHRIQVEVDKPENEKGYYFNPGLYGFGKDKSTSYKYNPYLE